MKFLDFVKVAPNGRVLFSKNIRKTHQLESKQVELSLEGSMIHMQIAQGNITEHLRTINYQGRLSIPISFRKKINWEYQDYIEMYKGVNGFYLRGNKNICIFCDRTGLEMTPVYGKYICDHCLQTALGKKYLMQPF
ncbi:hypothetical protein [Virgibacillus siamensis]|uniref:hypothetical protein n=1 Tax=Virgibacillus siamensis TaxID=480071 RepID=UPI0009850E56|nr:hypothetical protein [Virgibacillus siamensis]